MGIIAFPWPIPLESVLFLATAFILVVVLTASVEESAEHEGVLLILKFTEAWADELILLTHHSR